MTENEIKMATYIKDNILPKVQEIQRDFYLDKHISIHIDGAMCHGGLATSILVDENNFGADGNNLSCTLFSFHTAGATTESLNKLLRGMCHFIKNWQERLS